MTHVCDCTRYLLARAMVLVVCLLGPSQNQFQEKAASFQKEAMRTQVALWFLWSEICIEKFPCVWVNKTSGQKTWEKYTALKDCDQKEMLDLIASVYKRRDTSFMTYHLSYTQIGHFMGRETVYLCYDVLGFLQRWWVRNTNEIWKRYISAH